MLPLLIVLASSGSGAFVIVKLTESRRNVTLLGLVSQPSSQLMPTSDLLWQYRSATPLDVLPRHHAPHCPTFDESFMKPLWQETYSELHLSGVEVPDNRGF